MDEKEILSKIQTDRQRSPSGKVLYLEGDTDIDVFFALLGQVPPVDRRYQDVLVCTFEKGGGATSVRNHTTLARDNGYPGIFGVIDGDGRSLEELKSSFDPPFAGPLFTWKAFCIENLLAQTGWPPSFGGAVNWHEELLRYKAYVAINRVRLDLNDALSRLGLARFVKPQGGQGLKSPEDFLEALGRYKTLLLGQDPEDAFRAQVALFEAAVSGDLREAHALLNGKWLVEHMAPERTGKSPKICRREWIQHAIDVGGHSDAKSLWARVTAGA